MTRAGHPSPRWLTDWSGRVLGTLGLVSWAAYLVALLSSSFPEDQWGDPLPFIVLAEITLLAVLALIASAFPTAFRSYSVFVILAASGALAMLVFLGIWTIGTGILPSAVFFLSAGVLLSFRRHVGFAAPIGAFVAGVVAQFLLFLVIHAVRY